MVEPKGSTHLTVANELRSIRLEISRRMDRALNFSALWIGFMEIEGGALCRINHRHSAAGRSLPVVAEVVTRNLHACRGSTVTMAPDLVGCGAIHVRDSAVEITNDDRFPPRYCPQRTVGTVCMGPKSLPMTLESIRHFRPRAISRLDLVIAVLTKADSFVTQKSRRCVSSQQVTFGVR